MGTSLETPWHGIESANHPALALVNTLDWRGRAEPTELLVSYEELLRWARSAGLLTRREALALRASAREHPRRAERALRGAVRLREALASIVSARLSGSRPPAEALVELDGVARAARDARALREEPPGLAWEWRSPAPELERPIWAVALSAAELLTSAGIDRVRACADAECGWVFLDTSKNGRRRWCSMESCGNRNKARTFYRRATGSARKGKR